MEQAMQQVREIEQSAASAWQPIASYDGRYGALLTGGGYTIFGALTAYGWHIIADDTEYGMPADWVPEFWAAINYARS